MTYKGMILSALLVPFTIIGNDASDTRIQQLKNDLHAKELELSELSQMVEEKQAWIDSITERQHAFYAMVSNIIGKEEKDALKKELNDFQEQVDKLDFSKGDILNFLKSYALNNIKGSMEFERMKSWCIRYNAEYHLLNNLIKRYEQCLQEFIALEIELKNLQS